jgi:E3 ubiquitin-protein ligase TRIP12
LFPFQTRQLFFKLISFIGAIDMNRSIYFLKQFLKSRGGKLTEDKNAIKISKQKATVERSRVLESAFSLMKQINKRAFLEIEFKDEVGTGLGPTLEFYCILADEIKTKEKVGDKWRKGLVDNSLFPAPISMQKISNEELQKTYELFRLTGTMIAKSIVDNKLIDLPLSPLFWDLLLGKVNTHITSS